jgi:hypothetical protein
MMSVCDEKDIKDFNLEEKVIEVWELEEMFWKTFRMEMNEMMRDWGDLEKL